MSLPLTTRFEYCHEPEEPQRCAARTRVIVPREEEEGLDRAEGKVEPADGTNGDPGRGRHRRGASCSVVDCTEEARRSRAPERDVARRCAQRNEQREETEEERKLRAPAGRCRGSLAGEQVDGGAPVGALSRWLRRKRWSAVWSGGRQRRLRYPFSLPPRPPGLALANVPPSASVVAERAKLRRPPASREVDCRHGPGRHREHRRELGLTTRNDGNGSGVGVRASEDEDDAAIDGKGRRGVEEIAGADGRRRRAPEQRCYRDRRPFLARTTSCVRDDVYSGRRKRRSRPLGSSLAFPRRRQQHPSRSGRGIGPQSQPRPAWRRRSIQRPETRPAWGPAAIPSPVEHRDPPVADDAPTEAIRTPPQRRSQ